MIHQPGDVVIGTRSRPVEIRLRDAQQDLLAYREGGVADCQLVQHRGFAVIGLRPASPPAATRSRRAKKWFQPSRWLAA